MQLCELSRNRLLTLARRNLRCAEKILEEIENADKFVSFYHDLTYQFFALASMIEINDKDYDVNWKTDSYDRKGLLTINGEAKGRCTVYQAIDNLEIKAKGHKIAIDMSIDKQRD